MRSVYSEIFQLAWNVFLDLRINMHVLTLFPLNTIISWNKNFVPRNLLSVNLTLLAWWLFACSMNFDISSLPVFQNVVCIRSLNRLLFVHLFQQTGFTAKRAQAWVLFQATVCRKISDTYCIYAV